LGVWPGLMALKPDEVRLKQRVAVSWEQVSGILDGTKWHRSARLAFVQVEDLAGIVTDSSAPAADVAEWREAGVEIVIVDPGPPEAPPFRPRDLRRAIRNDVLGS